MQDDALAAARRQRRNAYVQCLATESQRDAAVLRHAFLGDIEARHHLDARADEGSQTHRQADGLSQHAVDAKTHNQSEFEWFDMNIGSADANRLGDQAIDQPDDRGVVLRFEKIGRRWNLVQKIVEPFRELERIGTRIRRQTFAGIDFR